MAGLELIPLLAAVAMAWIGAGLSVAMARWAHRPKSLEYMAIFCWGMAVFTLAAIFHVVLSHHGLPSWLAVVPFVLVGLLAVLHRAVVGNRSDASDLIAAQEDIRYGELSTASNREKLRVYQNQINDLVAARKYTEAARLARRGAKEQHGRWRLV